MPVWQEVFILYYDKTECSKSDKCFSIEMTLEKKGKTVQ